MGQVTDTSMKRKQKPVMLAVLILACGLVSPVTRGATLTVLGNMTDESCDIQVNGMNTGSVTFKGHAPGEFASNGGTVEIKTLSIKTENCNLGILGSGQAHVRVSSGAGTTSVAGGAVFVGTSDKTAGFMLRELGTDNAVSAWTGPLNTFYNPTDPSTMIDGVKGSGKVTESPDGTSPGLNSGTSVEYAVGFVSADGTSTPDVGITYTVGLVFEFDYS